MKPTFHRRRPGKLQLAVLSATIVSSMGLSTSGALAQNSEDGLDEIVVTGSRIIRRDFEANSPIMTVDEELFENTSTIGIETVLNQLPQFVPAVTPFETQDIEPSTTSTPGASTLSLRGLGSNRNLVLIDGRRGMPVNASGAIDVNMIPSSAIARVETITGGASSVYGADAMAGVVNFILKNDYEGMELSYRYSETGHGDGQSDNLSGVFGANFGNEGNVLVGFDYARRRPIERKDRAFYREGWAAPDRGGDEFFITAPGISFADPDGGFFANNPSQATYDAVFGPGNYVPSDNMFSAQTFYLNPDGQTVFGTNEMGAHYYTGPLVNEEGLTFRKRNDDDGGISQNQLNTLLQIPMERYAMFARGRMDLNDNLTAVFQGNFASNQNNTILQYTPVAGSWAAVIPHGSDIYADSLEADGLTTRAAFLPGGLHGLNCAPTGGCTNSEVFPVPGQMGQLLDGRGNPNAPFQLAHVADYLGPRTSHNDTFSYQLLAGLEGNVGYQDWTWEASASYGLSKTEQYQTGFVSVERFRALVTSPNYGRGFYYLGNNDLAFANNFGGGIGACTSGLPVFEQFEVSDDCKDAILLNLRSTSNVEQKIAEFNMQGHLIDLPAGEARFAVGASYRENSLEYFVDNINNYRSWLDSAAGLFPSTDSFGRTQAREAYLELLVPVVNGLPFMEELNLEMGYRYSDMDPSGAIDTYKALFDWRVNDRVRFRGGMQVANRAPNIAELFQSPTQGFGFSFLGDLCSEANPGSLSANPANPNGAAVRAICEDLMGATGASIYYDPDRTQPAGTFGFAFGNTIGNPNLENETAETWTIGGVFNLFDRTTLSVDWYQIDMEDMITLQSADSVIRRCFDPSENVGMDVNYAECQKLARDPSNGDPAPTDLTYSNEAAMVVSGIDAQLNWGTDFWNGGVNVNFMVNITDQIKTRVTPDSQWNSWKGSLFTDLSGINSGWYDYRTFTTLSYFDNAGWGMSLQWRFLPAVQPGLPEPDTATQETKPYSIFDLSGNYRFGANQNMVLRAGINNLLDEPPEFTSKDYSDPNGDNADSRSMGHGSTNSGFYDVIGRTYFVSFDIEF